MHTNYLINSSFFTKIKYYFKDILLLTYIFYNFADGLCKP